MSKPAAARKATLEGSIDVRLARLEALLDPVFLAEIGWECELGILKPPMDHLLLGWSRCSVPSCHVETAGPLCTGCKQRQETSGMCGRDHRGGAAEAVQRRGGPLAD